ncbi:MAG TPA: glycogen synthase [Methylomirabilota bacterium]|nr:glycogen synthase [Methylomirabilota bacterium]
MKAVLMSREYPPDVYGGAGVHVAQLARHLAELVEVEVRCFGSAPPDGGNPAVRRYPASAPAFEHHPRKVGAALAALHTCLHFNADPVDADVVHCHTWYSMFGGIVARIGYGVPLVVTIHSLEPLRPWKREQLGRGYDLSSWVERTAVELADAVIAVSASDRAEILGRFRVPEERLRVIPNGVDTGVHRPVAETDALTRHGIDPGRPYVLFLGRLSRQKGVGHFLAACRRLAPEVQAVLCAWPPDTPEIEAETEAAVAADRAAGREVIWIREQVPEAEAVQLYSHARVFCCPSVYEPFGIINLEAMACRTPVVASAVGGIVDAVDDGVTGLLVRFETAGDGAEPADPDGFARDLAGAMQRLLDDPGLAADMGRAGRRRVAERFDWSSVARRVREVYEAVAGGSGS